MIHNLKDVLSGALFLGVAIAFAAGALNQDLGTPLEMGPGAFPLMLAIALGGVGIFVFLRGLRAPGTPIGSFAIRGGILVIGAPIVFGLTVRGLGLVPSLAVTLLMACYSSTSMTFVRAVGLAFGLTAFCVLVFSYGLGLPFPLLGSWLR